jgi:hypothetical protein
VGASLLPAELVSQARDFAVVLTAVAVALFYVAARLLEAQPWMPVRLSLLLLGSSKPPAYYAPARRAVLARPRHERSSCLPLDQSLPRPTRDVITIYHRTASPNEGHSVY